MKVLIINCGSSSLKYQIIDMPSEKVLGKGIVECIGCPGAVIKQTSENGETYSFYAEIPNHAKSVELMFDMIIDKQYGVLSSIEEIEVIGHRVVHGGEFYSDTVIIDDKVINYINEVSDIAPLHNPVNLKGVKACMKLLPKIKNAACFDTAFHQKMPRENYLYGLPYEFYEKYKIRKYGFHGISHKYILCRLSQILEKDPYDLKVISCHLGNGASIAAIKNGHSIDTTMGMTPLDGLIMGTRCGSLDPGIITYLNRKTGMSTHEIDTYLNNKSGILGISGISSDMRDIEEAAEKGNKRAILALDMYVTVVKSYISSYYGLLGGAHAVVFTAGVGENMHIARKKICEGLEIIGIQIDKERNICRGIEREIGNSCMPTRIFVIPTNEELIIARDSYNLVRYL